MGILEELETFVDQTGGDRPVGYRSTGQPVYTKGLERQNEQMREDFVYGMSELNKEAWSGATDLTMMPFDMMNAGLGAMGLQESQSAYPQEFREQMAAKGRYSDPNVPPETLGGSAIRGVGRAIGGGGPVALMQLRMALAKKFAPHLYKKIAPLLEPFGRAPVAAMATEAGAGVGGEFSLAEISRHTDDPYIKALGSLVGAFAGATPGAIKAAPVRAAKSVEPLKFQAVEWTEDGPKTGMFTGEEIQADPERFRPRELERHADPEAFDARKADFDAAVAGEPIPSIATPGQEATAWQIKQVTEALGGEEATAKWVGRTNVERLDNPDDFGRMYAAFKADVGDSHSFYERSYESVPVPVSLAKDRKKVHDMLGWSPEEVIKHERDGSDIMVREIAAASKLMDIRTLQVLKAAESYQAGNPAALGEMGEALTNLAATGYMLEGRTTDAGRAFNLLKKMNAQKRKGAAMQDMLSAFAAEGETGPEHVAKLVDLLSRTKDMPTQAAIAREAMENASQGWGFRAVEVWMAGLLSSPMTHAVNVKSNGIYTAWMHGFEDPISTIPGAIRVGARRLATGKNVQGIRAQLDDTTAQLTQKQAEMKTLLAADEPSMEQVVPLRRDIRTLAREQQMLTDEKALYDRTYGMEVMAQQWGLAKGSRMAFDAMIDSVAQNKRWDPIGMGADTSPFDMYPSSAKGVAGKVVDVPFRLLEAEDAFFKQSAYFSRLMGLGMKDAIELDVPIMKRYDHAINYAMNAPNDAKLEAMARARELTFTEELSPLLKGISNTINKHPIFKAGMPFFRTPVNVTREGWARIPGSPLLELPPGLITGRHSRFWKSMAKGGVDADRAIARQVTGVALAAGIYDALEAGEMTGAAPRDPRERQEFYQQGKKPFSRKVTDDEGREIWMSYARSEPLATPVGVMSTLHRWEKEGKIEWDLLDPNIPVAVGVAMTESVINKSMLQGPQKISAAMSDPERKAGRLIDNYTGSLIPAGLNQLAVSMDPYMRDTSGLPEAVLARIPWVREMTFEELREKSEFAAGVAEWTIGQNTGPIVPIRYDWAGREFPQGDPKMPLYKKAVAEYRSVEKQDEILQIMYNNHANPGEPPTNLKIDSVKLAHAADLEGIENHADWVKMALTLRKGFSINMDSHNRQFINWKANFNAHKRLKEYLPKVEKIRKKIGREDIPIDKIGPLLRGADVPDSDIQYIVQKAIKDTLVSDVIKDLVYQQYGRQRDRAELELIQRWIRNGNLEENLKGQINRQQETEGARELD